jgi:hypothetical protein
MDRGVKSKVIVPSKTFDYKPQRILTTNNSLKTTLEKFLEKRHKKTLL